MTAYIEGRHHPQQALAERVAFVAAHDDRVVGYIAGHRTTRFGYEGELQYLYVNPSYRRAGVATGLWRNLADWFVRRGIHRVCVNVNVESPGAALFYDSAGAKPLNSCWYAWDNIYIRLAETRKAVDDV